MTYPVLCDAIRLRHVVRFLYRGGLREVEPYVYGRDGSGIELLRGFQLRGVSRSGEAAGWKMFQVEDITSVAVTFEAFAPRAAYDPADKVIVFVNSRVEMS
jgi:hypothetical protein